MVFDWQVLPTVMARDTIQDRSNTEEACKVLETITTPHTPTYPHTHIPTHPHTHTSTHPSTHTHPPTHPSTHTYCLCIQVCQTEGSLILCEGCPSAYHLECLSPPLDKVPDGQWFCPECKQTFVDGVTDCSELGMYPGSLRPTLFGHDRTYRTYSFLSRRIVVCVTFECLLVQSDTHTHAHAHIHTVTHTHTHSHTRIHIHAFTYYLFSLITGKPKMKWYTTARRSSSIGFSVDLMQSMNVRRRCWLLFR